MASEQPHVLPRTVGSRFGALSDRVVPSGTGRFPQSPKPERGRGQRSGQASPLRRERPGSGGAPEWRPC